MNLTLTKLMFAFIAFFVFNLGTVSVTAEEAVAKAEEAVKTYTVQEVYANKASLKGQTIKVRGKVVKVSKAIMNRTWVHIEDGTGGQDTNRIVFRSANDSAQEGDTVTAQGTVDVDRDFGMGYFYSVLVEDSTFTK